jgi:Domain of unknown function (DUF6597)
MKDSGAQRARASHEYRELRHWSDWPVARYDPRDPIFSIKVSGSGIPVRSRLRIAVAEPSCRYNSEQPRFRTPGESRHSSPPFALGCSRSPPATARLMEGIVSQFAGSYREWSCHASLRGHVRYLWINDPSRSRNECLQVVPDGCLDIVLTGETLCIAGPDTRPVFSRMPCGATVVGVRFHPGAASAWQGQPLDEIVNVRVPLAEFWGDDATRLLD